MDAGTALALIDALDAQGVEIDAESEDGLSSSDIEGLASSEEEDFDKLLLSYEGLSGVTISSGSDSNDSDESFW